MIYRVNTDMIKLNAYEKIEKACEKFEMNQYSFDLLAEIIGIVKQVNSAIDVFKEYSEDFREEQENG